MVISFVKAFVVVPIEVATGLYQHIGLKDEVALLGLNGEPLATSERNDTIVSIEVDGSIFNAMFVSTMFVRFFK